jgi:predicted dehydrogenase
MVSHKIRLPTRTPVGSTRVEMIRRSTFMTELGIAIIGGAGIMGRAHSISYALAPVALDLPLKIKPRVLVDVDGDRAAQAASSLGWPEHSDDWRSTVARDDIDIVDIVTPPNSHAEIATVAARHGKHIFVEKPITNSVAEAIAMDDAVRAAGVVGQVAFNYRHAPAVAAARRLIDAGEIGTPLQFRGNYLIDVGFSMDLGWRGRRVTGGPGVVGDLGAHLIDMAEYHMGTIARVSARLAFNATRLLLEGVIPGDPARTDDFDIDDSGSFLAEFSNGASGTFAVGMTSKEKKNGLSWEIDGSHGYLAFHWNRRDELQLVTRSSEGRGLTTWHMGPNDPDGLWPAEGFGSGYLEPGAIQIRNFVEAIAGIRDVHPSFADAVHVQEVIEAVYASDRTSAWTTVADLRH